MNYAGDIAPRDAYDLLTEDAAATLIDCRTEQEWAAIGVPSLPQTRLVEWVSSTGVPNPRFVEQATPGLEPDHTIVIICRSGARSAAASNVLAAAGFTNVFNVLEGFEGDLNAVGIRVGGWQQAGLPWEFR